MQTLRPKSDEVKAIPPLKFPYFDPDTGRYEIAQTEPIALLVKPAKVFTSADVEGDLGAAAPRKSELENWTQGIAYNYEGPEILVHEVYRVDSMVRSPLWLTAMLVPFLMFSALLIVTKVKQRQMADSDRLRSRKAIAHFRQRVRAIGALGEADSRGRNCHAELLEAIRAYFGDKLQGNGSALTFADIEMRMEVSGTDPGLVRRLRELFDTCERATYGGSDSSKPFDELVEEAVNVIGLLDGAIG